MAPDPARCLCLRRLPCTALVSKVIKMYTPLYELLQHLLDLSCMPYPIMTSFFHPHKNNYCFASVGMFLHRLSPPKFQWVVHLRCNTDLSKQCRVNFHLYLVLHSHKDHTIHRQQLIPRDNPHLLFISSELPLLP